MMVTKFLNQKNYKLNLFLLFSLIGISIRVWISQFGSNFDFTMWQINLDLFKEGKSIYEFGNYTYSTPWIYTLYFLDTISLSNFDNISFIKNIPGTSYRFKIIVFLSLIDIYIFYLLYKNYSLKIGLLFILNPISIILTGHHNAFDNYAILFGLLGVLMYGELNEKITLKKLISIFLFGLSLSIKHILFFFPLWWAFKEKKLVNKLLVLIIPYFIFLITFTPFLPEDFQNIIYKIFYFGKSETGPFWKIILPEIFDRYLSFHTLFSFLMIILGFCFVNKDLKKSFYLYLIAVIAFAPAMYTQYLFIPLIAMVIYCNLKTAIFTIITSLLFLVDSDQLNIQYLREIFDWNLRYTRIVFYPLTLILLIEFFEKATNLRKINSTFFNLFNIFLKNVKNSFFFKNIK
ncbi:hypothetical protein OA412_00140 [Candidatus Pelagibacter sp.]|nr:hypothetical protein [Candidatus Pelagibacter sp.]